MTDRSLCMGCDKFPMCALEPLSRHCTLKYRYKRKAEKLNANEWTATIKTKSKFKPIRKGQKFDGEELIRVSDAITTTWMILEELGICKQENPQLEKTIESVFATAPTVDVAGR